MIEGNKSSSAGFVGSLLNGIGSFASSLFGLESQKDENQKNRDFALEMWNRQNAYNSPANQRQLLEEGGYNPYALTNEGLSGQSQTPLSPPSSALPQFLNPIEGSTQLLQQGLQMDSNIDLQRVKMLESISDTISKLYKDGGQKQVDEFLEKFAPMLESIDWSGSFSEQFNQEQLRLWKSQRYNVDMNSLLTDLQYRLGSEYSPEQLRKNISETDARIKEILSKVDLNKTISDVEAKRIVGELAEMYAQVYKLKKEGDKYVADAQTVDALREGLVRQTDAIAGLQENNLYISNVLREANQDVYGYMMSRQGKRYAMNKFKNNNEWTGSTLGYAVDKFLGDYIKIGGSVNANYGQNHTYFGY